MLRRIRTLTVILEDGRQVKLRPGDKLTLSQSAEITGSLVTGKAITTATYRWDGYALRQEA